RMVNTLYSETASDEALADFNNDGLAEIAIGRIASRDVAGVTNVYNKTLTWENSLSPTSMDRGALFAYDLPDGYDFQG
ncbi:C25 family cysteine peptidase, partial [Escherichia coli]|nr:C25 family cysteine peptidase [Escherichia coli]